VLNKLLTLLILLPNLLWSQSRRYEVTADASDRVIPGMVVVKLKNNSSSNQRQVRSFDLLSVQGVLHTEPVRKLPSNARHSPSILDGIFWVTLDDSVDPIQMCNQLLHYEEVEYAEVLLNESLFFTPNDPSAQPVSGNQGYLGVIKAYEAWEITKGRSDIVIGVVDSGMDMVHQDLSSKYFINTNEAPEANGIDDDDNGYIDDINGYDFADHDANAQADGNQHGTHVGGIAGAATNNGIGIAGVGFESKLAPLKGFTTVGTISTGVWEAVYYAAENGYDVLNLSFGSAGNYNQFIQDLINYCVLEKNVVVVAAAGNTNADLDFYPASYENVLSVAGTTLTDTKWSSGSYGHHVDITAPAQSIYSTQNNNTYNSDSGSSHATPQVAGAAALVKSVFTQYNARQIMEQLRVTSDDIYGVTGNSAYSYKLGKGRLNVYRAVTESTSRSLRITDFSFDNGFGNHAFYGDTVRLQFDVINFLAGVNSPAISLISESPHASMEQHTLNLGAFQTMESKSTTGIKLVLAENTPPSTKINLRFTMQEGSYSDFQNVSLVTNPNYVEFGNDDLSLLIAGDGSLCFTDANFVNGSQMVYKGDPVLKYAGLIVATGTTNVQDNVVQSLTGTITRNADFTTEKHIKLKPHDTLPFVGYSEFSSANDDFWVEQTIVPAEENKALLLSYRVINTSGSEMPSLHVGLFTDYVLGEIANNRATWDENMKALIFYDAQQSMFSALKIISDSYHYAALDMQAANGNTRDIGDTFTDADKYSFLTNSDIANAGLAGNGNDVAGLVSRSFSALQAGESVQLAFVLALGDSYEDLNMQLGSAVQLYAELMSHPPLLETVYSCEGANLTINPSKGLSYSFYQDAEATEFLGSGATFTVTNINQDSMIYVKNLDGAFASAVQTIKIIVLDEVGQFSASVDTLYLDHPTVNIVSFTDQSFQATAWSWDFGNGTYSSIANPAVNFTQPGTYPVSLTINSAIGCTDEVIHEIVVAVRPEAPSLSDFSLCRNETVDLIHPIGKYAVYNAEGQLIARGSEVVLGPFEASTHLFIAQQIDGFESLPVDVLVTINPLMATFSITPDLTVTDTRAVLSYNGISATSFDWSVNGVQASTSNTFSLLVDGSSFDLSLTVSNESCMDTIVETIHFAPSELPAMSTVEVCLGESGVLIPENGTYFGFYADAALTQLISKGEQLLLEEIMTDQTVYVVGLDQILPSAAVSATIHVTDFSTSILANPPSLILAQSPIVQFSTSEPIVSAQWFVNDVLIETALAPIILFTTPGTFEIKLVSKNSEGCTLEETINYEVISEVTGIDNDQFSIYPNPVTRGQTIYLPARANDLKLYGLDGKLVASSAMDNQLTVPKDLMPGMYVLSLQLNERSQTIKLLIQ